MRYVILLIALTSCYKEKAVNVEPDYPPEPPFIGNVEDACSKACTNLRLIKCPEGSGATSGETCEQRCTIAMELRTLPLVCWARAENTVKAKACGQLRCIP